MQNIFVQIAKLLEVFESDLGTTKLYLSKFKWSGELGYHNCAHDFGSYTSDAICECNPQPNGTCPSGAFKVPLSCTRASMVPLKKRFISNFIKELHHQ